MSEEKKEETISNWIEWLYTPEGEKWLEEFHKKCKQREKEIEKSHRITQKFWRILHTPFEATM